MRKSIRIVVISPLVTLFTSQVAIAQLHEYGVESVGKTINTATGRLFIMSTSPDSPTYDSPTQSYHVPVVKGEEVTAPDPVAVAQGDATPKTKIVGNEVVLKIPGTDIVKLANGTWTNVYPSSTLADTYQEASAPSPDSYDGKPAFSCPNSATKPSDYVCSPDNILALNTAYIKINYLTQTPVSVVTISSVNNPGALNSGTCDAQWGSAGTFWSHAGFFLYCNQVDATHWQATAPNASDGAYVASKFVPGNSSPATSDDIGERLAPKQSGWKDNGLADDYKKAAENGTPSIDGVGPSDGDIQGWKDANGKAVDEAISIGISGGGTTAQTDGSGTGAQEQTTGQLAGIQNTLNKLKDELTKGTYSPSELGDAYTLPEVDFGARLTEFTDSVKSSSLFSLPNSAFNVPGGGSSQLTINGGAIFGVQTVDLADMSPFWAILKTIVLCCFSFVGVRIVCLKGGSQ